MAKELSEMQATRPDRPGSSILGGQTLAAFGAPVANDMTAANGRHAGPEAMTALAYEDAGLIGAFHGKSPST